MANPHQMTLQKAKDKRAGLTEAKKRKAEAACKMKGHWLGRLATNAPKQLMYCRRCYKAPVP